jgi:hypothetical protein
MEATATESRSDDGETRYRLGNAAWIVGWVTLFALMCYQVADPEWIFGTPVWGILTVAISVEVGTSLYRALRRRRPRSEITALVDTSLRVDERQRLLRLQCQAAGGIALLMFGLATILLGFAAMATGVRIDSTESWIALTFAVTYGILGTYSVAMRVTARHYSRRG